MFVLLNEGNSGLKIFGQKLPQSTQATNMDGKRYLFFSRVYYTDILSFSAQMRKSSIQNCCILSPQLRFGLRK